MKIESFSIAPGASVTVPLLAVTGQTGEVRAPLPTPDASVVGEEYFTIEVVGTSLKITGVSEGTGSITLITENQRITYPVTIEATSASERWNFAMSSLDITFTPPPEPAPVIDVNDSKDPVVQITHDKGAVTTTVDWGDGIVDTATTDTFDHIYGSNGAYKAKVTVGSFETTEHDILIANADAVGGTRPPTASQCYGPFDANGINFWICVGTEYSPSLGFDVDSEPGPDIQVPFNDIAAIINAKRKKKINTEVRQAVLAKLRSYL